MKGKTKVASTTDEYIAAFPKDKQAILTSMRNIIKKAAPNTKEVISYAMPAFKQNGTLVYFALAKNHLGFYPTASGTENFKKELEKYDHSKGTIRFLLDKPLPAALITKIVKFRVKEDAERAKTKLKK